LTYSDISITVADMTTYDHAFGGPGEPGPFGAHHFGHGGFGPRALFMTRKGRGHGPRGGHGFGPFGGGFGPGGPWGRGGRRARRGDVRAAILLLLEEEPRNGYGLMQEIEQRSEGEWRPSPGSVYPALSQLEDEGLVRPRDDAGRKSFELTDEGRAYVEENREALGTPWEAAEGSAPEAMRELGTLIRQVAKAAAEVIQVGDERQVAEARKILADARRALYLLLAGDESDPAA
jgi:DNA-binding PadR family transcriptional regulator